MNIVALKTFLTIVELRNLNKAAERLNVTQSTISARLDTLEESLGQKLLLRSRRGAEMTKAGFALQRYAENIVETWERGRRSIELPEGFDSTVSISCEHDLWEGNVSQWVAQIGEDYPKLALEIWPGTRNEISGWLKSGLIDAAVTREALAGDMIATRSFSRDELVHVKSSDGNEVVRFIEVDYGTAFRRQFQTKSNQARFTFGEGGNRWALDRILKGGYSGYLPRKMVQSYLDTGQLILIEAEPVYDLESHLSWRRPAAEDHPWLLQEEGK